MTGLGANASAETARLADLRKFRRSIPLAVHGVLVAEREPVLGASRSFGLRGVIGSWLLEIARADS